MTSLVYPWQSASLHTQLLFISTMFTTVVVHPQSDHQPRLSCTRRYNAHHLKIHLQTSQPLFREIDLRLCLTGDKSQIVRSNIGIGFTERGCCESIQMSDDLEFLNTIEGSITHRSLGSLLLQILEVRTSRASSPVAFQMCLRETDSPWEIGLGRH